MSHTSTDVPLSAAFFETIGLKEELKRGFIATGFDCLSSLQQRAMFAALDGFGVIVSSSFGCSENVLCSLITLQKIDSCLKETQVLVLTPSHESGREIRIYVNGLGRFMKIKCQVLSSETEIKADIKWLDGGCQIVIGTPIRIARLLFDKKIKVDNLKLFVLCDYDENATQSYEKIFAHINNGIQRLYFIDDVEKFPKHICFGSMKVISAARTKESTFADYNEIVIESDDDGKSVSNNDGVQVIPKMIAIDCETLGKKKSNLDEIIERAKIKRQIAKLLDSKAQLVGRKIDRKSGLPLYEDSVATFKGMGIYGGLLKSIESYGFYSPTSLQQKAIPAIINENEVIIEAVTSCGKTVAIAIAAIQQVLGGNRFDHALVITQSSEAAIALSELITSLTKFTRVTCIDCGDGKEFESMNEFTANFDRTTNVIVGTAYQLNFLVLKNSLYKKSVKMVIVDDSEKLFGEGFYDQVYSIIKFCDNFVKKVFICRTMTYNVSHSVKSLASKLVKVIMESDINVNQFRHYFVNVKREERKFSAVCQIYKLLNLKNALVFCNSNSNAYELQKRLQGQGFRIIDIFTHFSSTYRDVDATSNSCISAIVVGDTFKGDVDLDVELIINYQFPIYYEAYKQRLSGRHSNVKAVINLAAGYEVKSVACIQNKFNIEMKEIQLDQIRNSV